MAAAAGSSRALLVALSKGKDIGEVRPHINAESARARDPVYRTPPLCWALRHGASKDVVSALIDAHPDSVKEHTAHFGWLPLHYVERASAEVVQLLLQKHPEAAKVKDSKGKLPLHWAMEHTVSTAVIKHLVEAYPDGVLQEDNHGRTPYKLGQDYHDEEAVKVLVQAKPEIKGIEEAKEAASVEVEEPLPVALLFPGQGSQMVGMLSPATVKAIPGAEAMLQEANEILGWDMMKLCAEGPEDKLEDTLYCQPVMFMAGLVAVEKLKSQNREAVTRCMAVAGLSLGEYTAMVVAGVLPWQDGLKLVMKRAKAMQDAANMSVQGMCSCAGLDEVTVQNCCREAVNAKGGVCQIANYLFPKGFSISGSKETVEDFKTKAEEAKALQARMIKTSGAFHTQLMEPAKATLQEALNEVRGRMKKPRCKLIQNVTAQSFPDSEAPDKVADSLAIQVTSPVKWEQTCVLLAGMGIKEAYELGPNKQLKAMMKRTDQELWKRTVNIDV